MSRVSVLVPVYNGAPYLARCLQSVQDQTFTDWLLVVADDHSTDASVEVVQSMAMPRLTLTSREQNLGWAANVNRMIAETDSPYIAVLHQDDWWEPSFLERMVGLLERQPASLMATSAVSRAFENGTITVSGLHQFWPAARGSSCPSDVASRALTQGCCIFTPSVLARGDLYRRVGGYEESLPQSCDWLMWLRAAAAASIEVCSEPLATFREHAASQTARIAAANRRGADVARMVTMLQAEWRGQEPFPGASRQLAATGTVELLAYGATRLEAGDASSAVQQARLARSIAPSLRLKLLAWCGEVAFGWTRLPPIRRFQAGLLRAGRVWWHVTHRASQAAATR